MSYSPSWADIGELRDFIVARADEEMDRAITIGQVISSSAEDRATLKKTAALRLAAAEQLRDAALELAAAPVAQFRHPQDPAVEMPDDSVKRTEHWAQLRALAWQSNQHPEWRQKWEPE
jgi:imidazoleglycerol phosphate dehydratase HisB